MPEATATFPEGPFLSFEEAAAMLQVDRTTLSRWIKEGRVPESCYVQPSKKYIFSRTALERWVGEGGE